MIYSNALIPLVAESIHIDRNDRECHRGHFCCAKAGVSRRKSVMPLRLLLNHRDFLAVHKIKILIIFLAVRLYVFCEYDKIYTNIISKRGEKMEHIKEVEAYGQK